MDKAELLGLVREAGLLMSALLSVEDDERTTELLDACERWGIKAMDAEAALLDELGLDDPHFDDQYPE